MRAILYKGEKNFALENLPMPVLEKGEVLIEVKYAGICGSDLFIWLGKHQRIKPNTVLGHEFSGKIVDIKDDGRESNLQVGDRVAVRPNFYCGVCDNCQRGLFHLCRHFGLYGIDADGGFAEFVKVKKENVVKTFNKEGVPNILGSLTAAALITILSNAFVMMGLRFYWKDVVTGFVLLIAVAVVSILKKGKLYDVVAGF